MNDTSKVTEAGQVTIPKHLRDKHKITSSTHMRITTIGTSIIFQKDINNDTISYSFLYTQITQLQNELNKQKELYETQQQSIIAVTMLADDLKQSLEKIEQNKKEEKKNGQKNGRTNK